MKAEGRARRRRYNKVHQHWRDSSRAAKLAVPAAVLALLTAGAVASANSAAPASTAAVEPALVTRAGAVPVVRDDTLERTSRLLQSGRPPLTAAGSEAEDASERASAKKEAEQAQQETADKKAAEKADQKKAADNKADQKKDAERKAAEKKKETAAKARVTPTAAQLKVKGERYTKVSLNVRTQPKSSADLVAVLKTGSKLKVTNTTRGSWTLVIHRSKGRWVHSEYLVKKKPATSSSSSGGISSAPCSSGSSMESGLTKDAIKVHRAVCSRFPSIKNYGGMRSGGGSFHSSGRAVDIMVSGSKGQDVADWVRANRKQLGVSEIIYAQRIWTVQRGGEGWRSMSSRGNATANHYDHVHVSVYGNSATG